MPEWGTCALTLKLRAHSHLKAWCCLSSSIRSVCTPTDDALRSSLSLSSSDLHAHMAPSPKQPYAQHHRPVDQLALLPHSSASSTPRTHTHPPIPAAVGGAGGPAEVSVLSQLLPTYASDYVRARYTQTRSFARSSIPSALSAHMRHSHSGDVDMLLAQRAGPITSVEDASPDRPAGKRGAVRHGLTGADQYTAAGDGQQGTPYRQTDLSAAGSSVQQARRRPRRMQSMDIKDVSEILDCVKTALAVHRLTLVWLCGTTLRLVRSVIPHRVA